METNKVLKIIIGIFIVLIAGRLVFLALQRIHPPPAPTVFIEEVLPDKNVIVLAQRTLLAEGFYDGEADGISGEGTRRAIRLFQKQHDLNPSGTLDSVTLAALQARQSELAAAISPQETTDSGNSTGTFSSVPTFAWAEDKTERVRQIQSILQKAGFYKGKVDGKKGPRTRKAIKAFQKSHHLTPDGIAGPKTMDKLKQVTMQEMKQDSIR